MTATPTSPPTKPTGATPPGLPTTGWRMTRRWILDQPNTILELHRRFGDVATIEFAGGRGGVITRSPDDAKALFTAEPGRMPVATGSSPIAPVVGEHSLLTLNGSRHLRQRKLLLPPFHGDRMRGYADDITEIAADEIDRWQQGATMPLQPAMQRITLEVILRIVFGVSSGERHDALKHAITTLLELTERPIVMAPTFIVAIRTGKLFGPVVRVVRALDREIQRELDLRRSATDLAQRTDVLSMLLLARDEDGQGMTDAELRDELVTLLLAGHETTASALAWAAERLVRTPQALGDATDAARGDDPDGLLDAVFQETLRVRPVVPVTARIPRDPITISGYDLPAERLVILSILGLGRHPDRYERPDAFEPARFLGGKKDQYAWIPFGGGVRRCIGAAFAQLEGRLVLRELLRRVELQAVDPADERLKRRNVTLAPANGALVRLARVAA